MATQGLPAQEAEGKTTEQTGLYCYNLPPEQHGAFVEELSQYADSLEHVAHRLDVLGDSVRNLGKSQKPHDSPDKPRTDNGQFIPNIPALANDLDRLLSKLFLVSEYAHLMQKRNNSACGMDGIELILNDIGGELSSIIDFMRGEKHA